MRNSFELALDHLGRKIGGLPVEVIYEDDQQKPDVGKQKTEKLIESDKVDFVVGYIWSNVLLASLKPVLDAQTFLISANAGPSQIAGELCSPFFFSTSWQNDQTPQAMGDYMNQKGVKTAFLIGPNYAAGKDMLAGVQATFKGQRDRRGADQVAGAARLLRRAVEGARGASPMRCSCSIRAPPACSSSTQYAQAGLKGQIPLYTAFTIDAIVAAAAEGPRARRSRRPAMGQRPAQRRQQEIRRRLPRQAQDLRRRSTARSPTTPSASSTARSWRSTATSPRRTACATEMRKANYASVRGPYKYGNNHFPIQNFYLQDVVKDADGNLTLKTVATIVKDSQDQFHDKCPMKW